jgi:hypothetical protein
MVAFFTMMYADFFHICLFVCDVLGVMGGRRLISMIRYKNKLYLKIWLNTFSFKPTTYNTPPPNKTARADKPLRAFSRVVCCNQQGRHTSKWLF